MRLSALAGLIGVALTLSGLQAQDGKLDSEGYVRDWLVLSPVRFAAASHEGAQALIRRQLPDEGKLSPKADEKVKVGERERVWRKVVTDDAFLDLNGVLGDFTEDAVAYAVTVVVADREMTDVQLRVGSDDQCRVWLNGKAVLSWLLPRGAERDQNTVSGLKLVKGENLVVFKIVNEKGDWKGILRITDKDGNPLGGLTVKAGDEAKPDDEGFIRNWLVLAPIPYSAGSDSDTNTDIGYIPRASPEEAAEKDLLEGEHKFAPKEGDKLTIAGVETAWKAAKATEVIFDLKAFTGGETDNAVAYLVAYLVAETDISDAVIKLGSDDQCRVILNGKEIFKYVSEGRGVDRDQDIIENVSLKKGKNVLVFKIANGVGDWAGCLRLLNKDGGTLTGVTVELKP